MPGFGWKLGFQNIYPQGYQSPGRFENQFRPLGGKGGLCFLLGRVQGVRDRLQHQRDIGSLALGGNPAYHRLLLSGIGCSRVIIQ